MNMDIDADINYDFNIKKGKLILINGIIKTKIKGEGVNIKINSNIEMKLK